MEEQEWGEMVVFVTSEIRNIVRAQRTLADVHDHLKRRDRDPLEEDWINADLRDEQPGQVFVKDIDGVRVEVRMLHRRGVGSRDIKGADMLYEIVGRKYVLIQYKTPHNGRVTADQAQLDALQSVCPEPWCAIRNRWPRCGSWHCVRDVHGGKYHQACEAVAIFGGASSRSVRMFASGMSKETFDELFALCWIGAPISPAELAYATWSAFDRDRVLFVVRQLGEWV